MKTNIKITRVVMAIFAATLATGVYAQGGTAKPPVKGATGPFFVATPLNPTFTNMGNTHGFDLTGFLQDATSDGCGGTATLNGITITIPCGMIVQMPANTLTWNEMVNPVPSAPSLTLTSTDYPSTEFTVTGNIVGGQYIAGLVYVSQQSLNGNIGVITNINYGNGTLEVQPTGSATPVVLQINDPHGRFGRPQSPDPRFSVDDENPTIHAATGYPMCVPRAINPSTGNANPVVSGIPQDPLCPQKNRPRAPSCRSFANAGVAVPVSGELTPTISGYCTQFVMKAAPGAGATAANTAGATDPDVRQQAPFERGDTITYSGTQSRTTGVISVHTIEANVGIYTQPGFQPSYLAIGGFGIGTADPTATALNGAAQETQDRIFLEAETTDVKTPVDIFLVDVDAAGNEHNRWVTPFEMTGECQTFTAVAPCYGLTGGITTQNTGPQPQRARIRAAKSIPGMLSAPSRTIRVMARTLCNAAAVPRNALGLPADLGLDTGHSDSLDTCFNAKTPVANGLIAGQYLAPVGEYIFPENVKPGDPVVPYDLWHLPFLVTGPEQLVPSPW